MLTSFREHIQGIFAKVLIVVIVASFALWGIGNYLHSSSNKKIVAKVNGTTISQRQIDDQYERMVRRQPELLQFFRADNLKKQALQSIVAQQVLLHSADRNGMIVSEDQIRNVIINTPDFQVEGKFNLALYQDLLRANLFSDAAFRDEIRNMILSNHLQYGLVGSAFADPAEVKQLYELLQQQRDVNYTIIKAADFTKKVSLEPKQIRDYYDQHPEQFTQPDQIKIAYVELKHDDLVGKIEATDAELQDYFSLHQDSFQNSPKVHAAHILISMAADADEQQQTQVGEKLALVLAGLAEGTDFAELAKQYSDDTASADKGGDLGWFISGEMIPKFEAAAFALRKPGEISEPVKTEFGYHIIKLIAREEPQPVKFAAVKDRVKTAYSKEQAEQVFLQQAEHLANLAYEHADSLEEISAELDLPVQTTEWFSKTSTNSSSLLQQQKIKDAAFGATVFNDKLNSDPVELSDHHYVVLRLADFKPEQELDFDLVKKDIENLLRQQEAQNLAEQQGEDYLTAAHETKQDFLTALKSKGLAVTQQQLARDTKDLPADLLSFVFELPVSSVNQPQSLKLSNGDYALVYLNKVIPGKIADLTPEKIAEYRLKLAESNGHQDYSSYYETLITQASVSYP